MTLRQHIDQVITEIDQNPSLTAAPLSTIGDMLRRAVEQSASQALTTLEELDSEVAATALGMLTPAAHIQVWNTTQCSTLTWTRFSNPW